MIQVVFHYDGGIKVEMTLEQAKELYEELKKLFGEPTPTYVPYPVYPQQPYYPNWPIITCTTVASDTTK